MKIIAPCVVCAGEQKTPDVNGLNFIEGELDESGVVYITCEKGHDSAVMYDARRHEVLLRSGGAALLHGHANESISSFSAALERAYEFYIRVICRENKIDQVGIDKVWGSVSSQSERQFGAFSFLYLIHEKSPFELNNKIPEIRNKIIHKGRIAKNSEALEFAELIYSRVKEIERSLSKYVNSVEEESRFELNRQESSIPKSMEYGCLKIMEATVNKQGEATLGVKSFSEYLVALKQNMEKGLA